MAHLSVDSAEAPRIRDEPTDYPLALSCADIEMPSMPSGDGGALSTSRATLDRWWSGALRGSDRLAHDWRGRTLTAAGWPLQRCIGGELPRARWDEAPTALFNMEGKSNKSFVLNKVKDVSFEDRPVPKLTAPNDVLVAIAYTGICGSDVHYWQHGGIGKFALTEPMVLGHESAGVIAQVGEAVTTLKVGDRVAVEPGYPCRRCPSCLAGKYNLCPKMQFAATPPVHGTLTGFWAAPEDFCYKLPDNMSLQEGALIEPLAVGVHIARMAQLYPGQSVVVMGAGPVGLLCAAVAKAFGASTIVSVDIVPSKLEFAKGFAATHTYLSQRISAEENANNIKQQCGLPEGADVVIDATGAEPSIQASVHVLKNGGHYVQGGMGKADITFPIMAFAVKEATAHGCFRYGSGDYKLAVDLVASGKIDAKKLISQVVPFENALEAFEKAKEGQAIKMLIAGPNEKI
ncbi:hypothetical protein J7T55_002916 [Diaporthe amygdali]|nr:uncharacterized protein J7T55_002916 [Diaporthe amygdali]KAJ0122403.1 hypothetical protein J7T55_002916 [Diaporthe amygdali]